MNSTFFSLFISTAQAADPPGIHLPDNGIPITIPDLANLIVDILTRFAYPLAFIALVYTSYILITSAGKPEAYTKAKKNLTYVVIGIFLIVLSVTMVRLVRGLFALPTP